MEHTDDIKNWLGTGSINLFGRPFAGKDSQARLLAEIYDGSIVGGGDILRNSTIPEDIKAIMRTGQLIPSDAYVTIVLPYLGQEEFAGKPLILSSVGRWYGEEAGVMQALEASGHPLKAVIYLRLDEADVMDRWSDHEQRKDRSERHDESEHILQTRFEEFRTKTTPVIEFYREKGLLIEIDGAQSREAVQSQILEGLSSLATHQD